jgi:hypothetical protein
MAKKDTPAGSPPPPANKSQAIRDLLAADPTLGSKEVIARLAARGIKVAPSLLYMVKSKLKQGRRRAKRDRVSTAAGATVKNPVEVILRVKELARELGGYKNLKLLVDLLAE